MPAQAMAATEPRFFDPARLRDAEKTTFDFAGRLFRGLPYATLNLSPLARLAIRKSVLRLLRATPAPTNIWQGPPRP